MVAADLLGAVVDGDGDAVFLDGIALRIDEGQLEGLFVHDHERSFLRLVEILRESALRAGGKGRKQRHQKEDQFLHNGTKINKNPHPSL